ncbi:MAG: hypothetical protein FK734_11195 [Asgard group archaeon]|nr:hypothetical protein [Asgard group archaeon]
MSKSNRGVIWLLLAGALMGLAFNEIVAFFMGLTYMIPSFILLVISGYMCARVIGRAGGEFSPHAKSYSLLLEGFVFGLAFDMMRFRYDWFINVFKYIAIGTSFILIAIMFKRNVEKFTEQHPKEEPQLGFMRGSILYIIAGFCFALTVNSVVVAFLNFLFFAATLPLLLAIAIFVMITAKPNYTLLDDESGVWYQLLAGGMLGLMYDLIIFRVIVWQDLLKIFVVFAIFLITASVTRMKESSAISSEGIQLDLDSKKTKKGKVVGSITVEQKTESRLLTKTQPTTKKKSSSKRR